MAYDIATRTGRTQHATVCDYHTSGSWNAVGTAAITARRMGLSHEQTRHALGIAEYHGPRSQMMRAIDHPTMVKDGSGWGAMAGVSAALMAADGFTGAPAITVDAVYAKESINEFWDSLGKQYLMMEHYFKPYAVCYWAQAAIAGALQNQREGNLAPEEITRIKVYTFHNATRLAMRFPQKTDEAQYSLPFPVGAALVHGQLHFDELNGDNLFHPEVLRLSGLVELIEDDEIYKSFPQHRQARVVTETADGRSFDSGVIRPLWYLHNPATNDDIIDKFRQLANRYMPASRADELEQAIWNVESMNDITELAEMLGQK